MPIDTLTDFPPGEYYIGDLCYVFSSESWAKIAETMNASDNDNPVFYTRVGDVSIAVMHTAYGDGEYEAFEEDRKIGSVDVDSGTIGCILLSKIEKPESLPVVGHIIHTFTEPFEVEDIAGKLYFGDVAIDTDPKMEQDEDYWDSFDYDEFDDDDDE